VRPQSRALCERFPTAVLTGTPFFSDPTLGYVFALGFAPPSCHSSRPGVPLIVGVAGPLACVKLGRVGGAGRAADPPGANRAAGGWPLYFRIWIVRGALLDEPEYAGLLLSARSSPP